MCLHAISIVNWEETWIQPTFRVGLSHFCTYVPKTADVIKQHIVDYSYTTVSELSNSASNCSVSSTLSWLKQIRHKNQVTHWQIVSRNLGSYVGIHYQRNSRCPEELGELLNISAGADVRSHWDCFWSDLALNFPSWFSKYFLLTCIHYSSSAKLENFEQKREEVFKNLCVLVLQQRLPKFYGHVKLILFLLVHQ